MLVGTCTGAGTGETILLTGILEKVKVHVLKLVLVLACTWWSIMKVYRVQKLATETANP